MKRLLLLCLLCLLVGGCFLWQSFPDNDPLTAGFGTLFKGFQIVGVKLDTAQAVAEVRWAIADPETGQDGGTADVIAYGITYLPLGEFSAQKYNDTVEYVFRDAVKCINNPDEVKPCKIPQSEPEPAPQ